MLFGCTLCQIMEQLRPKKGNPLAFYFRNLNNILLNFYFLVVLVHIFFSNTKIFKIPSKVDANENDVPIGLNDNIREPGETNKNK